MEIFASDIYTLLCPTRCELRMFLEARGAPGRPPGDFERLLFELGLRHERRHLETLGDALDLGSGSREERASATRTALEAGEHVLYQPVLRVEKEILGRPCTIIGSPDFMLPAEGTHVIRDAKLARKLDGHEEIPRQMEIYGWLYEAVTGSRAARLEVVLGDGSLEEIPLARSADVVAHLEELARLAAAYEPPWEPVGWSKCQSCAYCERCWDPAVARQDVSILQEVHQSIARALRDEGVHTIPELLARFDEATLTDLRHRRGEKLQRVGAAAPRILEQARAMQSGKTVVLQRPELPTHPSPVMLDLEGLPPPLDELDRVYLWGLQVFGEDAGPYLGVMADTGADSDVRAWRLFLERCDEIFARLGDVPFVHWAVYEKTKLLAYIERYGDPNGRAARVLSNLVDLHAVTKRSLVLPIPSLSLKVVEKHIGFTRTQSEYGGAWSMAAFIEAVETDDEARRSEVLEAIRVYNEEDLKATRAVLEWLQEKTRVIR